MSPQAPREVSGENIVKQEKRQRDTTHGLIRRPHVYPGVGPKMKETEKQKQKTKTPRKNNRTPPRSTSFLCVFFVGFLSCFRSQRFLFCAAFTVRRLTALTCGRIIVWLTSRSDSYATTEV